MLMDNRGVLNKHFHGNNDLGFNFRVCETERCHKSCLSTSFDDGTLV